MATQQIPLSNHPLVAIDCLEEARLLLSNLYGQAFIEPDRKEKSFKGRANGVELKQMAANYVWFQHPHQAGIKTPTNFYTLQFAVSGSHVYEFGKNQYTADANTATLISSGELVKTRAVGENGLITLTIPEQRLSDYIKALTGGKKLPPVKFNPKINLSSPKGASLRSIIFSFIQEINRPEGLYQTEPALASFEEFVLSTLLFGIESNVSYYLLPSSPSGAPKLISTVEDFIRSNATGPVDMKLLADKTGHSISSIYRTFKKYRNYTPINFLNEIRFKTARKRLLNPEPEDTVTSIAMECGLFHLGRFSAHYKTRFGETPGKTLKKNILADGRPLTFCPSTTRALDGQ